MSNNQCITNLLKYISLLQGNSITNCSLEGDCTRPFLGSSTPIQNYNTRVLSLYKKDGSLFTVSYQDGEETLSSSFFRIMRVNNQCCTLLLLSKENGSYSSLGQTIIVQIPCIGAVLCVEDTAISNL